MTNNKELHVPITNAPILSNNQALINIVQTLQIGERSKHIDVAYHLVFKNIEYGQIALIQIDCYLIMWPISKLKDLPE
jgi:hypothetical protein